MIHFDDRDVVRHALVQQIVKAYETYSSQGQTGRMTPEPPTPCRRPACGCR